MSSDVLGLITPSSCLQAEMVVTCGTEGGSSFLSEHLPVYVPDEASRHRDCSVQAQQGEGSRHESGVMESHIEVLLQVASRGVERASSKEHRDLVQATPAVVYADLKHAQEAAVFLCGRGAQHLQVTGWLDSGCYVVGQVVVVNRRACRGKQ